MSRMLQNYQFLVGNDPNRRYPRDVNNLDELVTSIVNEVVGGASVDLDSLGELSAALQNNPDFLTTLQGRDAQLLSAVGIAAGDTNMGTFADPGVPDASDLKVVLEAIGAAATRLREGLGVVAGDNDMGTFTGSTIGDNVSVKAALQALETYCEANNSASVQTYVDQQIATDMWMFADQAAFPAAASNHGRVVHSHADGAMYFAHAGAWHKLQTDSSVDADESSLQGAIDAAVARLDALELDTTTATAVAAVQADVDANETAAAAATAAVQTDVDANEVAAAAATAAVQADVDQNEVDGDAADLALSGRLDVLEADPTTQTDVNAVSQNLMVSLGSLSNDVTANKTASDTAEAALSGRVDSLELDPTTQTAVAAGDAATLVSANAYTDAEIASLIDSAPGAINTLNELAAAIGDDADFAATVTNNIAAETTARTGADNALGVRVTALEADATTATAIAAVQSDVDANEAAALAARNVIQADVDQNEADADSADAALSARLDTLESDPTTATGQAAAIAAIQSDVDQNESDADVAIAANEVHIDNLATLSGVAKDDTTLGNFGGSTISNGADIKQALGELEASVENRATTTYVDNELAALVDGAPAALNTLNEIAAAIADDADLAGNLTALINANETHIDNAVTLTGVAKDATNLGSFTGSTITNDGTVKAAVQELETAFEAFDVSAGVTAVQADVDQNEADSDAADAAIVDGTTNFTGFQLQSTAVTADGAELNILDGATLDVTELNILDGVTASTAEVNRLVGVTGDVQTQLNAIQADVDQNETDADAAIAAVQADVDQNETDADAAIAAVQADVDQNESDADAAIALKADIASPTLTGTPAAPTAGSGTNTTQIATTAFVTAAVANVIDSAPGALDTLNELAAAIADDASFSTTITNSIAAVQADVNQNEVDSDAAETALSNRLDALEASPTTQTALNSVISDLATEENARLSGDASEASARQSADNTLQANINTVQADVDQNEADSDAAIAANEVHIDNLATLSGVVKDSADYGTFTGSTISDSRTGKQALQDLETALELRSTIASPTFTGTPAAPTANTGTNTTQIASTEFVTGAVSDLVGTAPSGLNTLGELATALQSDTNAIGNLTTLINANTASITARAATGVAVTAHASFDASAAGSYDWANDAIASHGITSVARTDTGEYTVTFANAFATANYTVIGNAGSQDRSGVSASPRIFTCIARTTTTMDVVVELSDSAANVDEAYISFMVIGTLA